MSSVLTFGNQDDVALAHTDASAIRAWLESADEAAAVWLFDKYLPLVVHVCSRKLPRTWMAGDAAQDAMSRAFLSLRNFDSDRNLASWVATIASHVCVDYLRFLSRRTELSLEELPPTLAEPAAPDRTANVCAARELIASLAPGSRELMELHYFEGLTVREVAGRAGLSQSNVSIRLMRARQELAARAATLG